MLQSIPLCPASHQEKWPDAFLLRGFLKEKRLMQCNRIFLPFQAEEQYGVTEVGELKEMRPDVILLDENTLWEEGHAAHALESRGKPKDRAFITKNYHLLHRCGTLIQEKRVCIYVHNGIALRAQ